MQEKIENLRYSWATAPEGVKAFILLCIFFAFFCIVGIIYEELNDK